MHTLRILVVLAMLTPAFAHAQTGTPATNAFSFQGQLSYDDMPADVTLDVTFQLFSSLTGNEIGDVVSPKLTRTVQFDERGRFNVMLDFGQTYNGYPVFNGDDRYMQIVLLDPPGGLEEDILLSPRTKLAAAPMAAYALDARIPSLAEITDDHLVRTDELGSLALNLDNDDLGITIRPNGGTGALFSYSGIQATDPFAIETSDGDLTLASDFGSTRVRSEFGNVFINANLGKIDMQSLSGVLMDIGGSTFNIESNSVTLDTNGSIDLNSFSSMDIIGNTGLTLSSAGLVSLTGAIITLNNHQFNSNNSILFGDLLVQGNAFKPGGGLWGVLSDARFKENIAPMQGSLDTLLALRPVQYEYNTPEHELYVPGVQSGFVAQEVREVLPHWIDEADDGTLMLTPRGFEALVVDAMQELEHQHSKELDDLRRENEALRARLDRLERVLMNSVAN